MKVKAKIVGMGFPIKGEKNGRAYDFTRVSLVYKPRDDWQGDCGILVNIDRSTFEEYEEDHGKLPAIGDTVSVVLHKVQGRIFVDALL